MQCSPDHRANKIKKTTKVSFCGGREDFMGSYKDDTDDQEENDDMHPLPRRGTDDGRASQLRRKPTLDVISLASFGSERTVDSNGVGEIGDLLFITDEEMPPGQTSVLGKGSFATVRLARRRNSQRRRRSSVVSDLSFESSSAHDDTNPSRFATNTTGNPHQCLLSERSTIDDSDTDEAGQLVAVKIIEKSLLSNVKTMYRDGENQLQCATALQNVEREIAVMKLLGCAHPNLVSLLEVIDIPGSSRLYMVLEYVPLGEIMSHVKGTDMYERKWKDGEPKHSIAMSDGYFTEYQSALFFVDVIHGLATLHRNRIAHRDLKPENILLDERGFVKISDFGVSHLFEEEMAEFAPKLRKLTLSYTGSDEGLTKSLKRVDCEFALKMKSMSSLGKLTKTEGTWAYWSPEMCAEDSLVFSGYSCDVWASGVVLYIMATGRLPFFSDVPLRLFDLIAEADLKLGSLNASAELKSLLQLVLNKDPENRGGIGDCLSHPFCQRAREQRLAELGEGVSRHPRITSKAREVQQAFASTDRDGSSVRNLAVNVGSIMSNFRKRFGSHRTSVYDMDTGVPTEVQPPRKKLATALVRNDMLDDKGATRPDDKRRTLSKKLSSFFRKANK